MAIKVLVAYASKYGSTQEVAKGVAEALQETGLTADLQPMRTVQTLAGYSAVVLAAPLYFGLWHKDAHQFLTQHGSALAGLAVAIFALGPIQGDDTEWQGARAALDKELAKHRWLTPVAVEVFGGKYNPAKLHFPDRLVASLPASPLHAMPASDIRDWTAIRAWAYDLVATLQPLVA